MQNKPKRIKSLKQESSV